VEAQPNNKYAHEQANAAIAFIEFELLENVHPWRASVQFPSDTSDRDGA
jgi:hypothetical protein